VRNQSGGILSPGRETISSWRRRFGFFRGRPPGRRLKFPPWMGRRDVKVSCRDAEPHENETERTWPSPFFRERGGGMSW